MPSKTRIISAVLCCIAILAAALILNGCSKEQSHWEAAQQENTITAYQSFMENYPDGKYFKQAKAILDSMRAELVWPEVKTENSVEALQNFVDSFPNTIYTEEAHQLLAEAQWQADLTSDIRGAKLADPLKCTVVAVDENEDLLTINFTGPVDLGSMLVSEKTKIQMEMTLSPLRIKNPELLEPGAEAILWAAYDPGDEIPDVGAQVLSLFALKGLMENKSPYKKHLIWVPIAIEVIEQGEQE